MSSNKLFVENAKGQKISILIEKPEKAKGLAIIMHGLGGFKEQPHIEYVSKSFLDNNITTVRFDAVHTFGESTGGKYEDATVTNYYDDLEFVIDWVKTQDFYDEPFFLAGHSLGGICTALYAEKHPEKIKGLAPLSTVVSGKLSMEAEVEKKKIWKETGWRISESSSKPGLLKKIKWDHMEDRLKYDLLPDANKLNIPVLLIVGDKDTTTPLKHQKILFEKLPGEKEMHVVSGAPHTFKEKEHLEQLKDIFDRWIKKNFN
ncbi:hypothetical protein C0585_04245 [Candidatus Woesearchaeota archaeon]|nr:MAG: hypothetical protein C0585_04245 [Candidatus Woesearchaeota archaeon]